MKQLHRTMSACGIWILAVVDLCVCIHSQSHIKGPRDFCEWEQFRAECQSDEVVVMETARYGRMELGRCVRNDLGYVGCSNDVMDIADTLCSGRKTCKINVPNPMFAKLKPCLEDLKGYFRASYRCQKVSVTSSNNCQTTPQQFYRTPTSHGFLSSSVAMETSCGSTRNPWIVMGQPGQRINITLYDFNLANVQSPHEDELLHDNYQYKGCTKYATILEDNSSRKKEVCGTGKRFEHVYTSVGNTVEVRMHVDSSLGAGGQNQEKAQYLLEYQVFGCPDPPVPDGATYKREGDLAIISCHGDGAVWRLTCARDEWTEMPGSCEGGTIQPGQVIIGTIKLPSGLSIAIIIVISLLIGCVILGVGLLCLKRQQRRQSAARQRALEEQTYKSTGYSEYSRTVRENHVNDLHTKTGREANEYASIWEWPLPPPPVQQEPAPVKEGYNYGVGYQHNYRDGSVSSGDHTYQLPDADSSVFNTTTTTTSVSQNEVNPRYFELDPSDSRNIGMAPRTGTGSANIVGGLPVVVATNKAQGSVPPSPNMSHLGHYSN